MSERFPWAEVGLAKKMGVSRSVLRAMRRQLKNGADFEIDGRTVQWSNEAALQAARRLGAVLDGPGEKTARLDSTVSEEPSLTQVFTVTRRAVNPHMVFARAAEDPNGAELPVRVTHNRNFVRGFTFTAKKNGNGWALHGRTPRWPGRW